MTTHFPPSVFDEWAPEYDLGIAIDRGFPFDGYTTVLRTIVQLASPEPGDTVLDLGIGSGNLALLLAERGCGIWGVDFSTEMLKLAGKKLPTASLAVSDLREELPTHFPQRFNHIVSAYTFHHFPLDEKVQLVQRMIKEHLQPDGVVVIGDIAFCNAAAEDAFRRKAGDKWEQEYYWLADETLAELSKAGFSAVYSQVSSCAGVFKIKGLLED
jgi:putative AdoMet-dependent methyltransferase